MEEFVYYNNLYDIYKELLTDNEKSTFEDYYQEDFSLSEIASNKEISRSAVQKTLKNVLEKLNGYEEKLHMLEKEQTLRDLLGCDDINFIKDKIEELLK